MATYYIENASGISGAGTSADPFHVDSTTDLDNILAGSYSGSTASTSGDIYIFKDGTYAGVRLNNGDADGVTFKAETSLGAIITWSTAGDLPFGVDSSGTATFTIDGFKFSISSTSCTATFTSVTVKNCFFDFTSTSADKAMVGSKNIDFYYCIFKWKLTGGGGYEGALVGDGNTLEFYNCTFIHDTTATNVHLLNHNSDECVMKNCIMYKATGAVNISSAGISPSTPAATTNNWAYNYNEVSAGDFEVVGTTNPLFIDTSTDNYRLRPNSPCLNISV